MTSQNKILLKAQTRELTGKKIKNLRKEGLIPAVIYGHGGDPETLSVGEKEFKKAYGEAGTSALIDLEVNGRSPVKVLSRESQINPITDEPIHIDFYRVKMDEKIKTEIPLEFIGGSEAVTQQDGNLVTNKDAVEVECLPADLISEVEVDISVLKTFEDTITVGDLELPDAIEVLDDHEEVIAMVEPPRSEEELAELEEPVAAEEEKEAIEKMEAEVEAEKAEGEEGEVPESSETPEEKKEEK